jgi:uncharacterized membrane protein (UPF0127 family)
MLKNASKGKVLANDVEFCRSLFSKAFGLMFRKKIKDQALVFVFSDEQPVPLHNLFVFQAIDVLFLNAKKQAVEIKRNFRPFTFYNPKKMARYVVELPSGAAKNTSIGDMISFK